MIFKNKTRLSNEIQFKHHIPINHNHSVGYKPQCKLCSKSYHAECMRHLNITIDEHAPIMIISPSTKRKLSTVCNHLPFCTHLPSFDNFTILTHMIKHFLLELKDKLLIIRDKHLSTGILHYFLEFCLLLMVGPVSSFLQVA